MNAKNTIIFLALVVWCACRWTQWHPWAKMLNASVLALCLAEGICDAIRESPRTTNIIIRREDRNG